CVALLPTHQYVKSRTQIPSRAFAIEWPPIVEPIIEARPGFAGTLRTLGGVGGHFGAPSSQHPVIEERPGYAGTLAERRGFPRRGIDERAWGPRSLAERRGLAAAAIG